MQVINMQVITKSLVGGNKDIFMAEFPQVAKDAERIAGGTTCGSCIMTFFRGVYDDPDMESKLKLIYGDDISIDQTIKIDNSKNLTQVLEVTEVPAEEWADWFKRNCQVSPTNQIRFMNTFFNPITNVVVVSVSAMRPKGKNV